MLHTFPIPLAIIGFRQTIERTNEKKNEPEKEYSLYYYYLSVVVVAIDAVIVVAATALMWKTYKILNSSEFQSFSFWLTYSMRNGRTE